MNLVAKVSLDDNNFKSGLKNVQSQAKSLAGNVKNVFSGIGNNLKNIGKTMSNWGQSNIRRNYSTNYCLRSSNGKNIY